MTCWRWDRLRLRSSDRAVVPVESAITTTVDIWGWLEVEAVAVVGVEVEGEGEMLESLRRSWMLTSDPLCCCGSLAAPETALGEGSKPLADSDH